MARSRAVLPALLLLLIPLIVGAEYSTRLEASRVAQSWLEHRLSGGEDWGSPGQVRIADCVELRREGRLLGWHLPVEPRGHMIVSLLKELPPIKAFSAGCDFDATEPGYPDMIQDSMAATLAYLEAKYGALDAIPPGATSSKHRRSWQALLAGQVPVAREDSVDPLLQSDWHQMEPYWDDCPPGDGGLCVVGCLATAFAQVFNYWRYPDSGSGSFSYDWGGDDSCGGDIEGQLLTANYADAYDWANIRQSYAGDYSPAEAAAVAELCYEIGVAFYMDYGHCYSAAGAQPAETVLPENFHYAEGLAFVDRPSYDADAWWQLIRGELDAFPPRPIFYGILAHAIVCDGYTEVGGRFYHVNFGWAGYYDGWYALDEIECPWGCDYLEEGMCTGLEPAAYFTVTEPVAGTVWTQGEPCGTAVWWGSAADSVVIDLYRERELIERLVDWTANDGQETPAVMVDPDWGTGSRFRIKVVGDDQRYGWSEYFGIYVGGFWTEVAADPLADDGQGRAAAWGDQDGDGLPDLYLVNSQDGNRLFGNQGGGVFVDLSAAPLDDDGTGSSAAWADYDNDGDLDLYLVKTSGQSNRLYRNDGGVFSDVTEAPLDQPAYGAGAAWADYDGDGLLDLYVVGSYEPDRLYRNEGGDIFSDATVPPLGDTGFGRSASWCDFDGDGDPDLYLVRNSSNRFYRNEGAGQFVDISMACGLADAGNGHGAAWGDYDNDGDPDLFLVNDDGGIVYRNDAGHFTVATIPPLSVPGDLRCAAWGDVDNDGWLDLYLAAEGENHLFLGEAGLFTDATVPLLGDPGASQAAAWADFDGDGDLDLYLVNEDQPNGLFRNDQLSGRHWLQVDLQGSVSNRSAIGACLRLVAGDLAMTRQVGGGAGPRAGNALTVSFGLGLEALVDTLEIHWPSGLVQRFHNLPSDLRYTFEEDPTSLPESTPLVFALRGSHPNPFNPQATIRFNLPEQIRVNLSIYDLSGRLVRCLAAGDCRFAAGAQTLTWDGRDEEGHDLPSGLYLCRLRAGVHGASCKLTLLR